MKIIYNSLIPFKGFAAINLFGLLFVRNDCRHQVGHTMINHESIHTKLMKELVYVPFYLWYIIEWFIKLFKYKKDAYYNISFEREAYAKQNNLNYLSSRKKYSWWRYLTNKV